MLHDDDATLLDIALAARRAIEGMGSCSLQDFSADWKVQSIVLHQLLLLGEAVKRLSQPFRDRYPALQWRQWAGLRDVLIHGYDIVDLETVWNITTQELPLFIEFIEPLLSPRPKLPHGDAS
ncbi:MAG: DUF86 domain-containing protein [Candidatus Sumerlaeota bacterium]|nr:DUF86 domain-containing protein [Candidatus Sumerlaeota bacterium]